MGSTSRLYNKDPMQLEWELGWVLEMEVEGDWEQMARKESDCAKKTSCVNWSYSETVINPVPGYD
jgi:hypothetical protein